jgi:acetyltransferase-like isoleucine patch superfamily enzyme
MKLPGLISSSRVYISLRNDLRRTLVRWLMGDIVLAAPGPPVVIADTPTFAPVRVHYVNGDPSVHVGRYCSIHETVTLVTGSEHPIDAVTTFFFYWKMKVGTPEQPGSRGPIVIGNDVWMGRDSLVTSGVTIGDGAVIASRAVVTRDVAPYEIVGGVPARHIGWRFDEAIRDALVKIAWWTWPVEVVLAHRTQLQSRDVADFVARHGGTPDGTVAARPCEICAATSVPDGAAAARRES